MNTIYVIRSERVVTPEGVRPATVHIRNGTITAVGAYDDSRGGAHVYDARKSVVMPGLVDTHVHINEPGRTDWEGFETATRAAAEHGSLMPPAHILNAPTRLMKTLGYGKGYEYDHAAEDRFSGQNYFPDGMPRDSYYKPKDVGFEREISKRLEYWAKLREKKSGGE